MTLKYSLYPVENSLMLGYASDGPGIGHQHSEAVRFSLTSTESIEYKERASVRYVGTFLRTQFRRNCKSLRCHNKRGTGYERSFCWFVRRVGGLAETNRIALRIRCR
jgi:hypothetical protein